MNWLTKYLSRDERQSEDQAGVDNDSDRPATSGGGLAADNPIRKPEEDLLGRAKSAQTFSRQILSFDPSEGLVVGVLGPWGSGKTSFVNLTRTYLKDTGILVLDFNPWMFSGAQQLVESFFVELSAQLKLRPELAQVGRDLEDYGEAFSGMAWVPLVGPWIERGRVATKILAKILQRRKEGTSFRRKKVEAALASLEKPVVVVIDDIDRLTTSEVRDIFKLVRLTANFPNVIYIVALDRVRVEEALAEQNIPGRDYLEKILQVAIDLPAVPTHVLNSQTFAAIDQTLSGVDAPGPFDENLWPDVFMEVIRPLLRNIRDVRRYTAAVHGTVRDLGGQVALVDLLGLEAVRVFLPDLFSHMHRCVDGLTTTDRRYGGGEDPPHLKAGIDRMTEAARGHSELFHALVRRLFPAAERHIGGSHYGTDWEVRWLRERRVAHRDVLRLYLERTAGTELQAFMDAEEAWARITDRDALEAYLRSLDSGRLEDVIASLEAFEDDFAPSHVQPGVVVLLNLLPDLPERERGLFEFGGRVTVGRVVYRLLRSLKDRDTIAEFVSEVLPQLSTLYAKYELIRIIGFKEGAGHKLVSETAAKRFELNWRNEVRSASVERLARERQLLWMLREERRDAGPNETPFEIASSPELTLAILSSALSQNLRQSAGSRAVRRSHRLAWDALVELYGDENTLRDRVEALIASKPKGFDDLLQLADKYLSGWRPQDS